MDFIKRWIEEFCKNCDKNKVNLYVKDYGYIWHAFSYELIPKTNFLEGEKAEKAFNDLKYKNAYYYPFFPEEDRRILDVKNHMDSKFFDEFIEVYVVAKNFSWTYIKTHESCMGLGPYFFRNPKK